MKKKKNYHWVRRFRHAAEKRQYYRYPELVRGRRSPANLPDPWDDYFTCEQKTWKVKRKKQYRNRRELNSYTIDLHPGDHTWHLTEYFEEQDIPYQVRYRYIWIEETITYWAKKEIPGKYLDKLLHRPRF